MCLGRNADVGGMVRMLLAIYSEFADVVVADAKKETVSSSPLPPGWCIVPYPLADTRP